MQLRQYIRQTLLTEINAPETMSVFKAIVARFPDDFQFPEHDYFYNSGTVSLHPETHNEFTDRYNDDAAFRVELHYSFIYTADPYGGNIYFLDAKCNDLYGADEAYKNKLQAFDVLIDGDGPDPPCDDDDIIYHQISNEILMRLLRIAKNADEFIILVVRTMKIAEK